MPGLDRLLQYVLCTDRFNPSSTKRQQRQKLTQPTYVKVNFNDAWVSWPGADFSPRGLRAGSQAF